MNLSCRVCGGPGRCVNYGALTCQACRAFFRRHGMCSKIIPTCPSNGECAMNVNQKKQSSCIACRLAKCVAVGMSVEYMRKPGTKKYRKLLENKINDEQCTMNSSEMVVSQRSTLDLLDGDRSELNGSEWKSLSNIIHAYDVFSLIPHLHLIVDSTKDLSDQPLPETLHPMNLTENIFMSTQSFIRSLPDFQILTFNEQDSLLRRNLKGLAGLNSTFVSRECALNEHSQLSHHLILMHGYDVVFSRERLEGQLDRDTILVKLMLVIATFSSNLFVLDNDQHIQQDYLLLGSFRLLGSQNMYVELLWKYMIYRYGQRNTVLRFTQLVKQILDTIDLMHKICQNSQNNKQMLNYAFERNREHFITHQRNEHVPLWGYGSSLN